MRLLASWHSFQSKVYAGIRRRPSRWYVKVNTEEHWLDLAVEVRADEETGQEKCCEDTGKLK